MQDPLRRKWVLLYPACLKAIMDKRTHQRSLQKASYRAIAIIFFLSGICGLIYEILWARYLTLFLGSTTTAYSIVLAVFMGGLSLGYSLIGRLADRSNDNLALFGWLQIAIGVYGALFPLIWKGLSGVYLAAATPLAGAALTRTLLRVLCSVTGILFPAFLMGGTLPVLTRYLTRDISEVRHNVSLLYYVNCLGGVAGCLLVGMFLFCFLIMFVPTIFFGMALPLASIVYAGEVEHVGKEVGTVFAFDTAGGVAGALVAGLLLIPAIGLRHTIELAFVINLAIGLVVFFIPFSRGGILKKASVGALSLLVVIYGAFFPEWDRHMMNAGAGRFTRREPLTFRDYLEDSRQAEILFYKEGRGATVSVERKLGVKTLLINSKPEASNLGDMPTQMLIGHLPLILSRGMEDVLVIGIGSGITIGSVLTHPVGSVDCVEISEAVYDASHHFVPENREYWKDGRVNVHIEDAKHFVKTATRQYDVIISEPSNPWVSGVGDLFSKEFFTVCAGLLKSGGVMAQWFHGYSMDMANFNLIVRTFASCFGQVTIWEAMEDDFVMIGCTGDFSPNFALMGERIDRRPVREDLALINIGDLPTLLSRQFVSPDYVHRIVGEGEVNRELMPVLEYNAPLVLFKRKKVSIRQIDERFSSEVTGLHINAYRDLFPLTALNYHNMAAYEFKNPFESDLQLAYSLMAACVAIEPKNEMYLYNFAILLQRIGKLDHAREIAARLLQIDKGNREYRGMFLDITYAIEQEKGSIFYPTRAARQR